VGSYDDLRNVIKQITDKTGDANAWQQGLTPQQIRDVNGWLASDGAGYKGYRDPDTGVVYEDRSHQNSSVNPAVPDEALDRLRQAHWQLFDPTTKAPISPAPGAPPTPAPPPPAPDINSPENTDPGLNNPPAPHTNPPPPPAGGLSTDEENSGRAADAINKVQAEMSDRQSHVREADAKLAEIMLSAHATSAEGRAAIQGLQQDIVAALNDPKDNLNTQDGELQFLKFLREKAETAKKLVQDGKLTSEDQAKMALALADFYKQGDGGRDSDEPKPGDPPGTPGATPPAAPVGDPGLPPADPGLLGPSPEMPDPMLGDLGLPGETSPLSDALGAAAPLLSGLGNPLGGGLPGGGMDLGAITKPIGDAISAAADHGAKDESKDEKPDNPDDKPGDEKPGEKKPGEEGPEGKKPGDPNQPPPPGQPAPAPAPGSVPDPAVAPPAPSLNVDLKDGSQVTATDPARAGATRSLLTGTQYGEALRQNGLVAPPPGTTLTNYLAPNQLQPADYAMYQDKLVGVLGPDKFVGADGRIEPLNTLPQDGFLGFGRPTAAGGTVAPAPAAPPPPAPVVPPSPLSAPQPAPPPPPQGPK
jgi:hypothetical protein